MLSSSLIQRAVAIMILNTNILTGVIQYIRLELTIKQIVKDDLSYAVSVQNNVTSNHCSLQLLFQEMVKVSHSNINLA